MYNKKEHGKGTRCHICTGCGRCFGKSEGLYILTDSALPAAGADREADGRFPRSTGREADRGFPQSTGREADGRFPRSTGREAAGGCAPLEHGTSVSGNPASEVCAVDLGTTTIAMVWYDGNGREVERFAAVNPQTRYGADVLSRVLAAEDRRLAQDMRSSVLFVLEQGTEHFRKKRGELPPLNMVIGANTVMAYLLMGWDPGELGRAPFTVSHMEPGRLHVGEIPATILPGLSAFVGGDILAGILSCGFLEREELSLLIDLGTNGEMVLGNRRRMLACSTAAGPAFEGGATRGIWGADMISLTAGLRREGALDESGLLEDIYFDGGVRIGGALVTRQDIRALQLAKGAVAAGIEILMKRYGLKSPEEISHVFLAGGFGYYLNVPDAVEIGLLPVCLGSRCVSVGNTSLAGAAAFARNSDYKVIEAAREKTEVFNLAGEEGFEQIFLESLNLKKTVYFGVND